MRQLRQPQILETVIHGAPYDYYYGTVEQTFVEPKKPKRKAKREEELSAGDTRLMDEFLEGFRRNGA